VPNLTGTGAPRRLQPASGGSGVAEEADAADLMQSDRSILHIAALEGHYDLVVALCMRGVDVNSKDSVGMTPLHEAAWHGHSEICKVLMSKGMDPDVTNDVSPPHLTHLPLPPVMCDAIRRPDRLHVLATTSLRLSETNRCSRWFCCDARTH
jgi:ankyrin repeat protein